MKDNVEVARRITDAFKARDVDGVVEQAAEDCEVVPLRSKIGGTFQGRAEVRRWVETFVEAVPDAEVIRGRVTTVDEDTLILGVAHAKGGAFVAGPSALSLLIRQGKVTRVVAAPVAPTPDELHGLIPRLLSRRPYGVGVALVLLLVVIFAASGLTQSGSGIDYTGELVDGRSEISNLNRPKEGRSEFVLPAGWPTCQRSCPSGPEPFELRTAYLYPTLQRGVEHYVTSCYGGETELDLNSKRPLSVRRAGFEWEGRTGHVRVPLRPGQSLVLDDGQHRYRIRCLPDNFPAWDFERLEDPSHKFYSLAFGRSNDNEDKKLNPFVVVFDEYGVPVWWQDEGEGTLGGQVVEYQGKPYIYWRQEGERVESFLEDYHQLHTLDGRLAYQFESPTLTTDGHEFNLRPNGDAWLDSYVPRRNTDFTDIGGPQSAWSAEAVVEQVRNGETIWRWSTRKAIHSYEARRLLEDKFGEKDDGSFEDPYDRVHLNSVEPAGDRVIVSLRNTDGVYGIDRKTREIVWKLGGEETSESLRTVGDYYEYPSGAQHDARVLPDGTLSVFDNRSGLDQPPRVTRWRIDEEKMTATLVEAYEDPIAPKSPATGSARFASDGSLFVYWGDSYLMTEFTPGGSIAFRLSIDGMAYRAFPVPDGLVGYRAFDEGMDEKSR